MMYVMSHEDSDTDPMVLTTIRNLFKVFNLGACEDVRIDQVHAEALDG
jgi:hypothetical protein